MSYTDYAGGSTQSWLAGRGQEYVRLQSEQKQDRQRTQALEDKQMELLDAEISNLKKQNTGGGGGGSSGGGGGSGGGGTSSSARRAAGGAAGNYLKKWNETLAKSEGMYSTALAEIGKAGDMVDKAYGDLDKLDTVSDDITGEWNTFKTNFEGVQGDLVTGAKDAIADRKTMRSSLMDQMKSDEEGVAGRAMADVSGMSERGRQAESMRLSGLGIDPTSGRARSMMRTSRNQEALSGAMAANTARRGEKDRVAGLTATGLQLIDPGSDINAATQIQNMSSNLLAQRSNMVTTKAGMQANLAGTRANIAGTAANMGGSLATNVASQYGDYGAAMKGIELANTPADTATSGNPVTSTPGSSSGSGAGAGASPAIVRAPLSPISPTRQLIPMTA